MIKPGTITVLLMSAALLAAAAAPAYAAAGLAGLGTPGSDRTPENPASEIRSTSDRDVGGPARGMSVASRIRPDYDPVPVQVGSFQLFPALEVGEYYESNLYALSNNEKSDLITMVVPTVALISNWGRHEVRAEALGAGYYHKEFSKENNTNGEVNVSGRYDITYQTWVSANAGYSARTERRGLATSPASAASPVRYYTATAGLRGYRGAGKLSAAASYDIVNYKFIDPNRVGGGKIDLSARDRTDHVLGTELNYRANTENFRPLLALSYNWRDYSDNPVRDSQGYRIGIGSRNDFGVLSSKVVVGYMSQTYERMQNDEVSGLTLDADLLWNITTLTSISGGMSRYVGETTVGGLRNPTGASGFVGTDANLSVLHELRRNTVLAANAKKVWMDYQGTNQNREDSELSLGGGARYLINRNLYGDMTYNYLTRDTNAPQGDYTKHSVLVRLGLQY